MFIVSAILLVEFFQFDISLTGFQLFIWPYVMKEPSNKNYTSYKERNPVGSYRRTFEVPADWDGREVYMQFCLLYTSRCV